MKKFSKILAAIAAGALSVCLFAAGCGSKVDYTFEAEEAILSEVCQVETGFEWGDGEPSDVEATLVGYFTAEGTTITFKIVSDKNCDATLTLRAASACHNMGAAFGGAPLEIEEVDLSKDETVKLTVNDEAVKLEGKLPGMQPEGSIWELFGDWGSMMKNCGTGTAKIHLKKGENVIVLTAQGYNDGNGGINVDKIVINTSAKLTWTPTDNSAEE